MIVTRARGSKVTLQLAEHLGEAWAGAEADILIVPGRTRDRWLRLGQELHKRLQKERRDVRALYGDPDQVERLEARVARLAAFARLVEGGLAEELPARAREALADDGPEPELPPGYFEAVREYAEGVLSSCLVGLRGLYEEVDGELRDRFAGVDDPAVLAAGLGDADLLAARVVADVALGLQTLTARQALS